jgi:hypothetical protein
MVLVAPVAEPLEQIAKNWKSESSPVFCHHLVMAGIYQ